MLCPNCDIPGERYKSPKEVPGLGTARRHRCLNCRKIFMSLQRTITGWAAERILLRLEEQDENSNAKPTESSVKQQEMFPVDGIEKQES